MKPDISDSKVNEFPLDLADDTRYSEFVRHRAIHCIHSCEWRKPQRLSGPLADRYLNFIGHYNFKRHFDNQHRFINLFFVFVCVFSQVKALQKPLPNIFILLEKFISTPKSIIL